MSERRQTQRPAERDNSLRSPWPVRRRLIVSVLLALHLAAVLVAPWSSPPPSSDLSRRVASWFSPYLHLAFLNHGYRFFAPNPGPSHLVRYELEMPDGSIQRGRFPDLNRHWPRLLYHRHFMVSETVFNIMQPYVEPPPPGYLNEEQTRLYQRDKQRAYVLLRSLARYLAHEHNAIRIRLFTQTHEIPPPWDLRDGMRLDDKRLYQERLLGEFTEDEL